MFYVKLKKATGEVCHRTNSITLLKRMIERARENGHLVSYWTDEKNVDVDHLLALAVKPTYNLLPELVEA